MWSLCLKLFFPGVDNEDTADNKQEKNANQSRDVFKGMGQGGHLCPMPLPLENGFSLHHLADNLKLFFWLKDDVLILGIERSQYQKLIL